jgi:type II secretory pathway pseudopilin PulG
VRSESERGFALVEALASLVVVAMISLMIFEGLGAGGRVWRGVDARETAAEAVGAAQSLLRERIGHLYPATANDAEVPYVDFQGGPDTMAFLSAPPMAGQPSGLRRYRLALEGGDLVLTSVNDAVAPSERTPVGDVLLRGVDHLDIAYFGADAADPTPSWRGVWNHAARPPKAVRIRLAFNSGDSRWWPDMIVRVNPTVGSDCAPSPTGQSSCGA